MRKIARSKAIQSGVLQTTGGLLIVTGAFSAQSSGSVSGWSLAIALIIGFYFLGTGVWRTRAAVALPRDKKK